MRDDPRQEPYAGNPPVRIRAGGHSKEWSLPRHMWPGWTIGKAG